MAHYRIVKAERGTYFVQERFMFFFWRTKGEEDGEFSGGVLYEFTTMQEARRYIIKLKKQKQEYEIDKIVEYH